MMMPRSAVNVLRKKLSLCKLNSQQDPKTDEMSRKRSKRVDFSLSSYTDTFMGKLNSENFTIISNNNDSKADDSMFIPSTTQLDSALNRHRKQREKKYLALTHCGPCCPCYNCVKINAQPQDDDSTDEDLAATDNVAIAFSHLHTGNRKRLLDQPILVGVPQFVKDFRKVMSETREKSLRDAIVNAQLNFCQYMFKCIYKSLIFVVSIPFRVCFRKRDDY